MLPNFVLCKADIFKYFSLKVDHCICSYGTTFICYKMRKLNSKKIRKQSLVGSTAGNESLSFSIAIEVEPNIRTIALWMTHPMHVIESENIFLRDRSVTDSPSRSWWRVKKARSQHFLSASTCTIHFFILREDCQVPILKCYRIFLQGCQVPSKEKSKFGHKVSLKKARFSNGKKAK